MEKQTKKYYKERNNGAGLDVPELKGGEWETTGTGGLSLQ